MRWKRENELEIEVEVRLYAVGDGREGSEEGENLSSLTYLRLL